MKKWIRFGWKVLFAVAVALLPAGACGTHRGAVLRWAHVYQPTESYHKWALWAADEIFRRTEERHRILVFPASSLGTESEINQGLSLGTADIIYTGTAFAGRQYGPLAISEAPYIFRDFEHWRRYFESPLFQRSVEGYERATGSRIVAATYYGQRHVTSNRPILRPEDMRGFSIRVPDAPLYLMFPRAVGANPTPIAFAEVYLALQQGVVDGQENPLPTIRAHSFDEVQTHINLTAHISNSLVIILGASLWKRLDEADRAIFSEVLQEAARYNTTEVLELETELLRHFEALERVTVNRVDLEDFRKSVRPVLTGTDAPWSEELLSEVEAL